METINVTIYNSEYKLRGDDVEAVRSAAGFVDDQMRTIATKAPMQPVTTTAVLAALNTAEQLLDARSRSESSDRTLIDRIDELTDRLDRLAREASQA